MNESIINRSKEFAYLGENLLRMLRLVPDLHSYQDESNFVSRMVLLKNSVKTLSLIHPMAPVAVTLLALPFPLQLDLPVSVIMSLLRHSFTNISYHSFHYDRSPLLPKKIKTRSFLYNIANNQDSRRRYFPVKTHPGASIKPNVRLAGLVKACSDRFGSEPVARLLISIAGKVYEDQAVSALLFAAGLEPTFSKSAWSIASAYILEPKNSKGLSNALKALGFNSTRIGSMLVEGDVMQGRGVGELDLRKEAEQRCDPDYMSRNLLVCDPDLLRESVRHIIKHELEGRDVNMPDLHDFWSSRWIWCVNGSETAQSDRVLGIDTRGMKDTHSRVYRRIASEMCDSEPITDWDTATYASASQKLENGKTRAIFACDTRSYFVFSWILNATQTAWRNSRVILDPGQGGHLGIVNRVQKAQVGGGVNLMLDYDDFNSAHSTSSMKIVFEELCDIVKAPEWYKSKLSDSFDNTFLKIGDKMERVLGTLMSGHRATTFINSILNAAYIRCAIGPRYYDNLKSLHTGDDVYIRADTLDDCAMILNKTAEFGCRMNPSKQSVGFYGSEFLRMGIRQQDAFGYLCRAISTISCGNWSNEAELGTRELLSTLLTTTHSLCNRSGQLAFPELISRCVRYNICSQKTLSKLLRCEIAVEGQPVWTRDGIIKTVRITNSTPRPPEFVKSTWSRNATRDYLSDHATPVESAAMGMVNVDVQDLLVASSYSKGLIQDIPGTKDMIQLKRLTPRRAYGYSVASQILQNDQRDGVLSQFPLIRLIETRLTNEDLRFLVSLVGGKSSVKDIRAEAFGEEKTSHNMMGVYSYSDASSLSRLTQSGNILSTTCVYV